MNEKPNEWVAIADLMSGVLAVVALMLVAAILLSRQQAAARLAEMRKPVSKGHAEVTRILADFEGGNRNPSIRVDVLGSRILLTDEAFDNASACLQATARRSLDALRTTFPRQLLAKNADFNVTVRIEGHTDSKVVQAPVRGAGRCADYSDNVGLSVARASEARKVLISGLDAEAARRFLVAGYGDTHPLEKLDPTDAHNRRVEVLFSVENPLSIAPTGEPPRVSDALPTPADAASGSPGRPGIVAKPSRVIGG